MSEQTVTLTIRATADGLDAGVDKSRKKLGELGDESERVSQRMSEGARIAHRAYGPLADQLKSIRNQVLGVAAAYLSFRGVGNMIQAVIQNTIQQEQATAQLDAVLRSTNGTMGYTRRELAAMAADMQRVSTFGADAIMEAQTRMLSYSGIVGENFPRAMQVVMDQSARLNISLAQSAETIGRALESPTKAAAALAQQGFGAAFTEEVRQVIDGLVDAGRTAEAQVMTLEILEESYGGAAKAARDTLGGGFAALKSAISDLMTADSLPALRDAVEETIKAIQAPETKQAISGLFSGLLQVVPPVVAGIRYIAEGVARFADEIASATRLAVALAPAVAAIYASSILRSGWEFVSLLKQQVVLSMAAASAAREMGIAQSTGFAASINSIGAVNALLGTAVAAIGGWQIGTWLREEFLEVEQFGIAMVAGLLMAWERLKASGIAAWEGIKAAALGAVNVIRSAAAGIVKVLADANEATDLFGIKSGITERLRTVEQQLRPTTSAWDQFKTKLGETLVTLARNEQSIDEVMFSLWEQAGAARGAAKDTKDLSDTWKPASREAETLTTRNKALTDAYREHARTMIELAGKQSELAKAEADYRLSVMDAVEVANEQLKVKMDAALVNEQLAASIAAAKSELDKETDAVLKNANAFQTLYDEIEADFQTEIRLAGMSEQARRQEELVLRAVHSARTELLKLAPEEREAREAELRAMAEINAAQLVAAETAADTAEKMSRAWKDEIRSFAQAAAEGTERVGDYFSNLWKRIKAGMIESGIVSLMQSLFNVNLGGGGVGFGSMLSIFGGGGSGGSGGGLFSAQSWLSAGRNLWSGFGQGMQTMPMVQSLLGGLSNLGAFGSLINYNGASMAAINAGMGAGGVGPSSALAGSGSTGGFGLTGSGAAAAGMFAWFAAAIIGNLQMWNRGWRPDGDSLTLPNGESVHGGGRGSATDSFASLLGAGGITITRIAESILGKLGLSDKWASILSGGSLVTRLFGRKAPELREAESNFNFGAGGVTGSERYFTVEKGGLFRSDRRTWHEFDLSGDILKAAEQMWATLSQTMQAGAAALGSEVPESFTAGFRHWQQLNGKTGEVEAEKFIVELLGRTWEEATAELALKRLNSEALIATIDAALGTVVQRAITGPGLGGGGPAPGIGPGRGGEFDQMVQGFGAVVLNTTQTVGEAFAIAERWRHDAELLAEGAQFLLLAASDIRAGVGLLGEDGTLTQITDLIEDLQASGETLSDTYTRVATSAALLDQALALSGVAIEGTREHVVRLATAITDAAGGLEAAQALWQSYFANFYDAAELAQYNAEQLRNAAQTAFTGAGLDLSDYIDAGGMERFRAAFEAALPTMGAEDIAAWLRAADALAAVTASARAIDAALDDNERQLHLDGLDDNARAAADLAAYYDDMRASMIANAATTEQLARLEDQRALAMTRLLDAQAEAAAREQAAAEADYQSQMRDVRDELDAGRMSEFALSLRDVARWAQETTENLTTAALAAGRQGIAEEDLAAVHQVAANRAAQAITQLRGAAASLVTRLFGPAEGSLDAINARIARIEANSTASFEGVSTGIDNAVSTWLSGIARVQDFLDSILLDKNLTTLTPEQQLAEAQAQFNTVLASARGGDADALSALPDAARSLLDIARGFWSSGDQYQAIFDSTRAGLQSVVGMAGSTPSNTGGASNYTAGAVVSEELAALYAERDALLAAQEAAHRAELMVQLGGMVRELVEATRDPLETVAASIGLNLRDLVSELDINLSNLSLETASSLVGLAQSLGVDVAELAASVGVSLGSLVDRQSLLNQALDATLAGVPDDIRAQLLGPLDAIRNATTDADANAAIGALDGTLDGLPADIRNLLAPYFVGLDPTPVVTQLTALSGIDATARAQLDAAVEANALLVRIADNLRASNAAADLPAYAAGGWVNGPTALLAGEAGRELILPNPVSEFFQRAGIPINTSGGGEALLAELRSLREEVRQLRAERIQGDREVSAAAAGAGIQVAEKIDRQTDADDRRQRELIAAMPRDGW